ncbi:hypothetical protein ACQ4PT_040551 [Festuca glaucescens]
MRGASLVLLVVLSAAAAASPQKDIIETINNHPNAGWTAGHNPSLADYTVEQFKHILGVKPTPPGLLAGVPTKTYPRSECDPYFDQEGCQHPGCEPAYDTPVCEKKCKVQNQVWEQKKHFSVDAYRVKSDPHDIMAEVYKNGPVEVAFTVYEDFAHYKSGVYKHVTGDMMGGHAVKLIGWGTSDVGEDYWLLANQWNRGWGDDGYFKIIRGTNECGIEEDVVAGMPSTKNTAGDHGSSGFGTAIL